MRALSLASWRGYEGRRLVDRHTKRRVGCQGDGLSHHRLGYGVAGAGECTTDVEQPLPVLDDVDTDHVPGLDGDAHRVRVKLAVARVGLVAGIAQHSIPVAAQRAQHLEVEGAPLEIARARLKMEACDNTGRGHGRGSLDDLEATFEVGWRRPGLPNSRVGQRRTNRQRREHQPDEKQHAPHPCQNKHSSHSTPFVGCYHRGGGDVYRRRGPCFSDPDNLTFAVDDIDDTLVRLGKHGAQLVSSEVVQYGDAYRLCYIRGPEGLLIGLAQELS